MQLHSLDHPRPAPQHLLNPSRLLPMPCAQSHAHTPAPPVWPRLQVHMLLVSISWTVYASGVLFAFAAMVTKVLYGNPKFM